MQNSESPSQSKWYYGVWPVLGALVALGPFGFPLLWKSPHFNLFWKITLTLALSAATLWMMRASAGILEGVMQQFKELKEDDLM